MNAFVPFASVAPRAACSPAPNVCGRRALPQSNFMGSQMTLAARPVAAAPVAAPVVRRGASTVRMDVTVVVGDNEPIESALRRFKKDVTRSGHLFELRRRRYFETATEKRIRKAAASARKARIARNMANKGRSIGM